MAEPPKRKCLLELETCEVELLATAFNYVMNTSAPGLAADISIYDVYAAQHGIPLYQCTHGTPEFCIWHRAYMRAFELELQKAPGCSQVTLPYWDPVFPQDVEMLAGIPDWIFDPKYPFNTYTIKNADLRQQVLTQVNATPDRLTGAFPNAITTEQFYNNGTCWIGSAPGQTPAQVRNYMYGNMYGTVTPNGTTTGDDGDWMDGHRPQPLPHYPGFYTWLGTAIGRKKWDGFVNAWSTAGVMDQEAWLASMEFPHNAGHDTGGGWMVDNRFTGFVPLFWFHHSNVDRWLQIWQQKMGVAAVYSSNPRPDIWWTDRPTPTIPNRCDDKIPNPFIPKWPDALSQSKCDPSCKTNIKTIPALTVPFGSAWYYPEVQYTDGSFASLGKKNLRSAAAPASGVLRAAAAPAPIPSLTGIASVDAAIYAIKTPGDLKPIGLLPRSASAWKLPAAAAVPALAASRGTEQHKPSVGPHLQRGSLTKARDYTHNSQHTLLPPPKRKSIIPMQKEAVTVRSPVAGPVRKDGEKGASRTSDAQPAREGQPAPLPAEPARLLSGTASKHLMLKVSNISPPPDVGSFYVRVFVSDKDQAEIRELKLFFFRGTKATCGNCARAPPLQVCKVLPSSFTRSMSYVASFHTALGNAQFDPGNPTLSVELIMLKPGEADFPDPEFWHALAIAHTKPKSSPAVAKYLAAVAAAEAE
eukprot:m.137657 g.137657  ORF g.137657 m.137657 type:complete len:696 (-) comp9579_c0_seq1:17-2104(-)